MTGSGTSTVAGMGGADPSRGAVPKVGGGSPLPRYADLATLARNLCAGESTIEALVRQGKFPQPYHLGGKRLWKWSEVEATIAASREKDSMAVLPATEEGIREAARRVSRGG